jgi:hypothetical protein
MECFLKSDSELGMVTNKLRTAAGTSFRYWQIVLKKPFFGDERNFPRPLMRFVRGDVRGHIVSHKNDHGPSYRRYRALQR